MQLIGRYNKGFQFKLYVIDIFSKYAWVIPLKDKKCIAITNGFQKMLDESNCKPKKVLLDKGRVNFTTDQWNHGCKIMT